MKLDTATIEAIVNAVKLCVGGPHGTGTFSADAVITIVEDILNEEFSE